MYYRLMQAWAGAAWHGSNWVGVPVPKGCLCWGGEGYPLDSSAACSWHTVANASGTDSVKYNFILTFEDQSCRVCFSIVTLPLPVLLLLPPHASFAAYAIFSSIARLHCTDCTFNAASNRHWRLEVVVCCASTSGDLGCCLLDVPSRVVPVGSCAYVWHQKTCHRLQSRSSMH